MDDITDHSTKCRNLVRHACDESRFHGIPVVQPCTFCSFGRGAIKGVQAAVLQSLQWDDNNSAFLITDLASQKKKKKTQENDFTHEESETMALQILEWIVSQSWRWRQFWTVASAPALITTQWLYSESLTQFRFLISSSRALWKDDFLKPRAKKGGREGRGGHRRKTS